MSIVATLAYVLPILATWRCCIQFQFPTRKLVTGFLVGHSLAAMSAHLPEPFGLGETVVSVGSGALFAAFVLTTIIVSQRDVNRRLVGNGRLRARISDPRAVLTDREDPEHEYVSDRIGFTVVQLVTLALDFSLLWNSVSGRAAIR